MPCLYSWEIEVVKVAILVQFSAGVLEEAFTPVLTGVLGLVCCDGSGKACSIGVRVALHCIIC